MGLLCDRSASRSRANPSWIAALKLRDSHGPSTGCSKPLPPVSGALGSSGGCNYRLNPRDGHRARNSILSECPIVGVHGLGPVPGWGPLTGSLLTSGSAGEQRFQL